MALPIAEAAFRRAHFHRLASPYGQRRLSELRRLLEAGETAYLVGIGAGGHNTGTALVSVSAADGVSMISNDEEERFAAVKHCADYPRLSVESLIRRLDELNLSPSDIFACLASWDYPQIASLSARTLLEELPGSLMPQPQPEAFNAEHVRSARRAPAELGSQLGLDAPLPIIGVRHHDAHAYFSYAASPFAQHEEPVMVAVLDGFGDDGTISLYVATPDRIELIVKNSAGFNDSIGIAYGVLSSTQGGWPILSSEGRYMGAAAWGDSNRETNSYYRPLRQLFYFGPHGEVELNRALARWQVRGQKDPYGAELSRILGPPIPLDRLWNPDAVLDVEQLEHAEITQERVDKAAAVQLVFEDALLHIIENLISRTRSSRLVLTGGVALNCVANMRLMDAFDGDYYRRRLGAKDTTLELWVPPVPNDAGTPVGAAYAFAMQAGARRSRPLRHAFYCGRPPEREEIDRALEAAPDFASLPLGDTSIAEDRDAAADLLAYIVSQDGVAGIYQGSAETGPRALGHRSIVANPTNPETLSILNARVKFRERIRPLAPMLTLSAALELFELAEGAAADDYSAYNFMILTARARPEARSRIPAVIHHDGTGRLQIVRPEIDPLCFAYLEAMGRRLGVEVSVNTSLNVGAPIAQTPAQAIETVRRATGLDALLVIAREGSARLVWEVERASREERLGRWLAEWAKETGRDPDLEPAASLPA